jgi:hypothetical protein
MSCPLSWGVGLRNLLSHNITAIPTPFATILIAFSCRREIQYFLARYPRAKTLVGRTLCVCTLLLLY